MNINNFASSTAVDARVKRAIDLTQADHGSFAIALQQASQANHAAPVAATTAAPVSTLPESAVNIDWMNVSHNLGRANGNFVYVGDLTKVADMAIADATSRLDAAFAEAGISNDPPVDIGIGFLGSRNLIVGNHPQKDKIDALFAGNPELKNDVYEGLALKENAVSWEKAAIYSDAYRSAYYKKGQAAADMVRQIFMSMNEPSPTFKFSNSGLEAFYAGKTTSQYLSSVADSLGGSYSPSV